VYDNGFFGGFRVCHWDVGMTKILSVPATVQKFGKQQLTFPACEIHKGTVVGLIGRSGSGKSILLRQLAGVLPSPVPIDFVGTTAFVFAKNGLLQHYSVWQNLYLASLFSRKTPSNLEEQITELLHSVQIAQSKDTLAVQLNANTNKMVQILRAKLLAPDIVFMENPQQDLSLTQLSFLENWIQEYVGNGGTLIFSDESNRSLKNLSVHYIELDGGSQTLKTILHNKM
jgi:ABC-type multidrug transport system ATPase subunit